MIRRLGSFLLLVLLALPTAPARRTASCAAPAAKHQHQNQNQKQKNQNHNQNQNCCQSLAACGAVAFTTEPAITEVAPLMVAASDRIPAHPLSVAFAPDPPPPRA